MNSLISLIVVAVLSIFVQNVHSACTGSVPCSSVVTNTSVIVTLATSENAGMFDLNALSKYFNMGILSGLIQPVVDTVVGFIPTLFPGFVLGNWVQTITYEVGYNNGSTTTITGPGAFVLTFDSEINSIKKTAASVTTIYLMVSECDLKGLLDVLIGASPVFGPIYSASGLTIEDFSVSANGIQYIALTDLLPYLAILRFGEWDLFTKFK